MKICEVFYSLQGEGLLMGVPTVFIRTAGCNLDCSWCDTPYAREGGEEASLDSLQSRVEDYRCANVCITGGEPLLQDDTYDLIDRLIDSSFHVTVETNGSLTIDRLPCSELLMISMDVKCPSSGMERRMEMENLEVLSPYDQLKFVVADTDDMEYAGRIVEEYAIQCPVIMTPLGGMELKPVAEWVLERNLPVRVLPQLHRIIWGDRRGV